MNRTHLRKGLLFGLAASALFASAPDGAVAQSEFREARRRFFNIANWSLEANAGYSNTGRMLLQDIDDRQRQLNPNGRFSWGAAASLILFERTQLRLGYTHIAGDLAYKDDTGDGGEIFDAENLGNIGASVLSLELGRLLWGERAKFTPYLRAGFAIAWWGLDEDDGPDAFFFEDETHTRTGATGALGLQYRATDRLSIKLEAAKFGLGNPFTGNESFIPVTGFTIDEPVRVSTDVYSAGLVYRFGRMRRR